LRADENVDDAEDRGYMGDLLHDYERGAIEPLPVKLRLADDVPPVVRRVADDLELLFGLRAAVMDDRPLPYACRWRTGEMGLGYRTVARALEALVACGAVVECDPEAPAFGRLVGTKMYLPGGGERHESS
jgi:hypothetical protein